MVYILNTTLVENPLRFGLRMRRTPNPCILVLFGVTGDLAHRKLLPAIYNLYVERRLPANFSIVGFARRARSHLMSVGLPPPCSLRRRYAQRPQGLRREICAE